MIEIKRYGLGRARLSGEGDTSVYGPDIVEMEGGEYYKRSEVDAYMDAIGAGGVTGNIDLLDAIIDQCEMVSNRLGIKDHQEALLDGELTLANALRASAWEVSLIGTLAKKLKEKIPAKTIDEHRAEFEAGYAKLHQPAEPVYLSRSPVAFSPIGLGFLYNNHFTQHAWEIWAIARGIVTFE